MRGKVLLAVDVDAVLPVAHLQDEEPRITADDGIGPIVQRREGGLWPSRQTSTQSAVCSMSGMASRGALTAAMLCCVVRGIAALQVRRKDSRACSSPEAAQG